jgi:hypothetical protein
LSDTNGLRCRGNAAETHNGNHCTQMTQIEPVYVHVLSISINL